MVLHGLLQVNTETIGAWGTVRRQDGSNDPNDLHVYDFELILDEMHGGSRKHHVTVEHRYSDGALALLIAGLQAIQDVRNVDSP